MKSTLTRATKQTPGEIAMALESIANDHPDLYDSERFWLREAAAVLQGLPSIPSETACSRDDVLEEAADLCDQKLDQFSGTECTYRCDVAQAIRERKGRATPTETGDKA